MSPHIITSLTSTQFDPDYFSIYGKNVFSHCAEDLVVAQLVERGATLEEIVMTPGTRPRTMQIVPVCKFCKEKYSRDNFIPGTPFE